MAVERLDRTGAKMVSHRISEELQNLAHELGVAIEMGGCIFDPLGSNAEFKIKVSVLNADGEAETKERQDFVRYARNYGLHSADLDRTFTSHDGYEYSIIGFRSKARKNNILVERTRGHGKYVMPAHLVVAYLRTVGEVAK